MIVYVFYSIAKILKKRISRSHPAEKSFIHLIFNVNSQNKSFSKVLIKFWNSNQEWALFKLNLINFYESIVKYIKR